MNPTEVTMSPEAQRIAIAKACGITPLWSYALPEKVINCDVPDYLNDLNAMHEAERVLIYNPKYALGMIYASHLGGFISATATERAKALLITINLWTTK